MQADTAETPDSFGAGHEFVYLTTSGRRSGNPHTIEIWAAARGSVLYFMAGGRERSDWVRNLRANPAVQVRAGDETRRGRARVVTDPNEQAHVRRMLAAKYQNWREGSPLSEWAGTALPVAVEIAGRDAPA